VQWVDEGASGGLEGEPRSTYSLEDFRQGAEEDNDPERRGGVIRQLARFVKDNPQSLCERGGGWNPWARRGSQREGRRDGLIG